MPRRTLAIVPLRSPGVGKTRLAPTLDADGRATLVGAMLGDVVRAVRAAAVDQVVVAASGAAAASAAAALGVEVVLDPRGRHGLDQVLAAAVTALDADDDHVLIVPADLPRLTRADVDAVLAADSEVVLAPTTGGGTGALLRRPANRIATAYGEGSAARHRALAAAAGASVATVERAGFRHDVDTAADLAALRIGEVGPATAAALTTLTTPTGHLGDTA
jgi:2-phospho-L-lactate/phosphoenolpyruvate guanylyltransferase